MSKDLRCYPSAGSSSAPLPGSTAAEGLPRIGRTSIATHWLSCVSPQSASCSENFAIVPDVSGQTLRLDEYTFRILVGRCVELDVNKEVGTVNAFFPASAVGQHR